MRIKSPKAVKPKISLQKLQANQETLNSAVDACAMNQRPIKIKSFNVTPGAQ